ncbi:hypothetical protein SKAU_G00046780 [Synaphobranchus kaupii]|uniref:Sema domain-containing protein n=1 Tax=Synaphobranchus kaupii TaxID=118154 RepID=A0A9Q1G319_SYNKA|nr:hypothetical protein SKAU_G00046780 [Synaphobranchus kaupii]
MHTTKEFPDDVVTFVRNHPMMFNTIYPLGKRPLVVRTNANYKYTTVAVDLVTATDGSYQVLFLGTDQSGNTDAQSGKKSNDLIWSAVTQTETPYNP